MDDRILTFSTISVAVVCMSDARHLARCLDTLLSQRDAPEFEIVAVCDPRIAGIESVRRRFPQARILINEGQRTPLELASRALRECRAELILLTKDYCVPSADWVHATVQAQREDRAAVGGCVEIAMDASPTDWAYYFIDFSRHASPAAAGTASSLTVCNVAYQRVRLEAVRTLWESTFVESLINKALCTRAASLWIEPASIVTMSRPIALRDAVHERYAYGRLFGYSRLATCSTGRRLFYALFAPALPLLMLGRMGRAALRSRRHAAMFVRSIFPLTAMVLARSWGEWLAYLTGRPSRSFDDAAHVRKIRGTADPG